MSERTAPRAHPVWLMRQAGRYLPEYRRIRQSVSSFWDLCMRPDLAAEITLQPLARFDLDYAIVFSDILVIARALGCEVDFAPEGLRLSAVRALKDVNSDKAVKAACYGPVYDALAMVRARLSPGKRLIGFAGGPWTLACYMTSGADTKDRQCAAKLWACEDPQGFQTFLRILADEVAAHLIRQLKAGADTVQIFDSLAGTLPDVFFDKVVLEPTQYIVRRVREAVADAQIIGFPRQASLAAYQRYAEFSGVDVVSLDTAVPMGWAARTLPGVTLQGNLDPVLLLAGSEALRAGVRDILTAAGDHPLIFNLGHGVLPETPVAHVEQLIALVKGKTA